MSYFWSYNIASTLKHTIEQTQILIDLLNEDLIYNEEHRMFNAVDLTAKKLNYFQQVKPYLLKLQSLEEEIK